VSGTSRAAHGRRSWLAPGGTVPEPELTAAIGAAFEASGGTYGSPRITLDLRAAGWHVPETPSRRSWPSRRGAEVAAQQVGRGRPFSLPGQALSLSLPHDPGAPALPRTSPGSATSQRRRLPKPCPAAIAAGLEPHHLLSGYCVVADKHMAGGRPSRGSAIAKRARDQPSCLAASSTTQPTIPRSPSCQDDMTRRNCVREPLHRPAACAPRRRRVRPGETTGPRRRGARGAARLSLRGPAAL